MRDLRRASATQTAIASPDLRWDPDEHRSPKLLCLDLHPRSDTVLSPILQETELLDTLSRCEEVVVDLPHRACSTLSSPATFSGLLATASTIPDYLISNLSIHKVKSELRTVAPRQSSQSSARLPPIVLPEFVYRVFRSLSFIILSTCRSTRLVVQNL